MSQLINFNDDDSFMLNDSINDENDYNYDYLLTNFIQFNISATAGSTQQHAAQVNIESTLKTCLSLCKALKLNKNFLEFLKKFNYLTQNLDKFKQFSALKCSKQPENLTENVNSILKLFNCYDLIIQHLLNNQNLVINNYNHVVLFINILLDLIRTVYTFIAAYQQQQQSSSQNNNESPCTQSQQQTLTQIVRTSFNSNPTLLSVIKLQNELIQKASKLIELVMNQSVENTNESELVNLSNNLVSVLKSIKNDAKLMIILWKLLSKFLIKNQKILEKSINLTELLTVLNDEIGSNLNYLKAKNDNSDSSNDVILQNLSKIIKICGLLLKLFKSIVSAYSGSVNEGLFTVLTSLLSELNYLLHCDLNLKQLKSDLINEFRPMIKYFAQFLLSTHKSDYLSFLKNLNVKEKHEKLLLALLSFMNLTDDLAIPTKIFQLLDFCTIETYLPNYYIFIDSIDTVSEAEVEFPVFFLLNISMYTRQAMNSNNSETIMNLVNFFLYYQLYGTQIQAQYACDCLVYQTKLVISTDFYLNLCKYLLTVYESTLNCHLKSVLANMTQTSSHCLAQVFDFIDKKALTNSQQLFFNTLNTNGTPQLKQIYQNNLNRYILSIQNQFLDCLNQFFDQQQVISIKLMKQFLLDIKSVQNTLEFSPFMATPGTSSLQVEQKYKEIYIRLMKLLKLFNINKLSKAHSRVIQFTSEIIYLLKLYNKNFKQLSHILNTKLIIFQLNFMQQFNIFIETTSSLVTRVSTKNELKIFKFYSIDYISSLSRFTSFDSFSAEITYVDLNDIIDEKAKNETHEKQLIDKLITYFCYLLNDSNCLVINSTLECLNDYCKHSKYFDFILAEIIRSNKLRMQDLVGNYLRKAPKKCPTANNDHEILLQRLAKYIELKASMNNCENVLANYENDTRTLIQLYTSLNKPVWLKSKLESFISKLNESL